MTRPALRRRGRAARAHLALVALVILATLPLGAAGGAAQTLDDRLADARQRQASLKRSLERNRQLVADLQADEGVARAALGTTAETLGELNADARDVRREIEKATDAIGKVQARRDALTTEISRLDWTLALLEEQIAAGEEDLEARRRLLGARLVEAYRSQRTTLLEQILADGSFTDTLTAAGGALAYGDQDVELARRIEADRRELDGLRALTVSTQLRTDQLRRDARSAEIELASQTERLAAARVQLEELEARTREIQERQKETFKKIAANRREAAALVARQAAAERQLRNQLAQLIAAARKRAEQQFGGGLGEGGGAWSWPTGGTVSQEFGCTGFAWNPPLGDCSHFHDGIDIANGSGTQIRAPYDGIVVFVGYNPYESDPAYLVVVAHPGGYDSTFAHLLPRAVVRKGQVVRKGTLLGYMGCTGNCTGTHLHWEVYRGSTPVNPRGLV